MALDVTLDACDAIDALASDWRALERRAKGSFFQSWHWIGSWLAELPAEARPQILTVRRAGEIVGLATLGRATVRRHGAFVSHGLYLNETGRDAWDVLAVEMNGILAAPDDEPDAVRAALAYLVRDVPGWDELFLSGVSRSGACDYVSLAAAEGLTTRPINCSPCRYVDLARLRTTARDYLDVRSRNTRAQIRRAMRRYEEIGPLAFAVARNTAEAQSWFDALETLHQASWTRRRQPGSFANPFFGAFHRRLIAAAVPAGAVELARVSAGAETVGILYNFIWRGHVCNYQSGFAYADDNVLRPGLVSHVLAIRHHAAEGRDVYDFLAGDSRFKASLATDATELDWLVARRPRLKYAIEDALRAAKGQLRPAN